ncbi:hypothetical protein B0I35DRAFT_474092 [Stachybotrys elegans]|uniref:Uncharacterized protein n=1 Tax=Stachybotrys elegans TaxID=80388 RepID=A0A8K0T443_9HYPO|nr:hypothetical protein B0I35DRAFT_474092 [Stachybotrys elegans]
MTVVPRSLYDMRRNRALAQANLQETMLLVASIIGNSIEELQQHPERFLGMLERVWTSQRAALGNPALRNAIRQMPVPCESGELYPLCDTYLPLRELQRQRARFMADGEDFPFLDLGDDVRHDEIHDRWMFLCSEFGVSKDGDVGFLMEIVSYIKDAHPEGVSVARCQGLVPLYCEIEARCAASPEPESVRDIVRSFFRDINGIAIPASHTGRAQWVSAEECTWNTRRARHPLKAIYEAVVGSELRAQSPLAAFFQQTLGVS